jgi:polygalacturonase
MIKLCLLLSTLFSFTLAEVVFSIDDYGAYANDESNYDVEFRNGAALENVIYAANSYKAKNPEETVVALVPEGNFYSIMPAHLTDLDGITIRIDGTIKASKRHTRYPADLKWKSSGYWKGQAWTIFQINDSKNLIFEGKGTVDGQGFMWWMRDFLNKNVNMRPHLFTMERVENVEVTGIRWINSPRFTMHHYDINNFYYHDFEIYVDLWGHFILG